jgi:putative Holliday junction resolvase
MILPNFKDFPIAGRVIGLDWGARRTGVAITDESCSFVFARKPIVSKNSDDLQSRVLSLIKEERVAGIIIGLPLRTDGTESETTKNVRDFAISLAEKIDTPICFLDETLSSTAAQESMGRVRISDIKEKLDSEAARVILENAIAVIKRL